MTILKHLLVYVAISFSCCSYAGGENTSPHTDATIEDAALKKAEIAIQTPKIDEKNTFIAPLASDDMKQVDAKLEKLTSKLDENSIKPYIPLYAALAISLIGALVTIFTQSRLFSHNAESQNKKSGYDAKSKLLEYRYKQINDFYGPLLVLIKQSYNLSRQLHELLIADNAQIYYYFNDPQNNNKASLYTRQSDPKGAPFRLISSLPYLRKNHASCLPYVKLILDTGSRIATLIEDKSGFADPSNEPLMLCFAEYLSHRLALNDAYEQALLPEENHARLHNAVYPRKLEELVRGDYEKIVGEISEWPKIIDALIDGKTL
ncbi:hypothetical protein HX817_10825 [Pseudomonas sp. C6002]|uniref:hypothetical protein n=1 Tax=Pseudomonas sp. C6002 TaxID=2738814 RepID=UPI0015A1CBAC|nr:hypothetical protein [Pseudomonas sp. C6002]NWA32030.1 hypothetical protein [Pseudomonas sp. C6002]